MRGAMVVVVVVVIAVIAGAVARAAPPVIAIERRAFDHDKHSQVSAAAGKPAACGACHTLDASGARAPGREHPRCAQCHTYPRACDVMQQAGPKGQARVCQICHTPTSSRCLPADLPLAPKGDSFEARFTHGKHLALGGSIEKDCVQCHPAQGAQDPAPAVAHKLCAGCHNPNGARPAITECQSCHQAPRARTAPAVTPPDPYRLGGFDHRAHHAVSKQASCLGCHDKLLGAGEAALPRPSMLGCQTRCHDGRKAFSAVGTRCTACHKGKDAAVAVAEAVFSHATHGARGVAIDDCAQCHGVDGDGRVSAPLAKKDHQPCAASGCHLNELASRAPRICGVCHDAASPWQKTVSRRGAKPATPQWFEPIDHAAHLAKLGTANTACASCHGDRLAGAAAPRGHDACAPCHARGQAPAMAQCGACHAKTPPARAAASAWSVRATFAHEQHARDPRARGAAAPRCTECHTQIAAAKDLAGIRAPAMADCDGCHDGTHAFKTTGFDCARCHARAAAVTP